MRLIGEHYGGARPPDLIEPVVGYREWRIQGTRLVSPFASSVTWGREALKARCMPNLFPVGRGTETHSAPAPASECVCGIYAFFEPMWRWEAGASGRLVAGAVILWGRIEVHRDGMRAEYARPVVLALPRFGANERAIGMIAGRLDLEVAPLDELRACALRYGQPLPNSLMPDAQSQ